MFVFFAENNATKPCTSFKPGDDDLQNFEFIGHLHLEKKLPGVAKVRGSNKLQTAFRLDREANLTLPTRYIRN